MRLLIMCLFYSCGGVWQCLGSLAANGFIVLAPDDGWENGAIAEWQIGVETEILWERPASIPLCLSQIPEKLPWYWTRVMLWKHPWNELHISSYPSNTKGSFPEVKAAVLEDKRSPLSTVEDCDAWRFSLSYRVRLRGVMRGQSSKYKYVVVQQYDLSEHNFQYLLEPYGIW
jgi:hypothetical protein